MELQLEVSGCRLISYWGCFLGAPGILLVACGMQVDFYFVGDFRGCSVFAACQN